jgi:hypothetical protein
VLAVRKEWQTKDDSIMFWLTDHKDDTNDKLVLINSMAQAIAISCFNCIPSKVKAY